MIQITIRESKDLIIKLVTDLGIFDGDWVICEVFQSWVNLPMILAMVLYHRGMRGLKVLGWEKVVKFGVIGLNVVFYPVLWVVYETAILDWSCYDFAMNWNGGCPDIQTFVFSLAIVQQRAWIVTYENTRGYLNICKILQIQSSFAQRKVNQAVLFLLLAWTYPRELIFGTAVFRDEKVHLELLLRQVVPERQLQFVLKLRVCCGVALKQTRVNVYWLSEYVF